MAMPERARQHPTVQADLAQAQAVVAGAEQAGRSGIAQPWLSPEASPGHQSGTALPSKGLNERSAENRRLRDSRPPRRHAPSTQMELLAWGAHGEAIRKAILLVDHAHDDGTLSRLTLNAKDIPPNADGVYRPAFFPYPARISVSIESPQPVFTTFHEIGHHIRKFLDPKEVGVIAEMARKTEGSQECLRQGVNLDYWLSDSELFSRIYSQWVAERVKHIDSEAFHELEAIKSSMDSWQQFQGNEWTKISNHMTILLKKKGWL